MNDSQDSNSNEVVDTDEGDTSRQAREDSPVNDEPEDSSRSCCTNITNINNVDDVQVARGVELLQRLQLSLSQPQSPNTNNVRRVEWLRSFLHLEPRYKILHFFNDVARDGVQQLEVAGKIPTHRHLSLPPLVRDYKTCGTFSVWRPTSNDAIRKMMTGEGVGKGLDIKGKSAKRGKYSGFVPYLQIHVNEDKDKVRGALSDYSKIKVFYPREECRDVAIGVLNGHGNEAAEKARAANRILRDVAEQKERAARLLEEKKDGVEGKNQRRRVERRHSLVESKKSNESHGQRIINMGGLDYEKFGMVPNESMSFEIDDPNIYPIDEYISTQGVYGLEIPEKLFWEAYVENRDITFEVGSEYDTGRPNMPEFQIMNMHTLQKRRKSQRSRWTHTIDDDPIPVLWHGGCGAIGENSPSDDACNPMDPRGLLMAYEQNDKVTPVVSDFDCFLFGTKGVPYQRSYRQRELSMLLQCIDTIGEILSSAPDENESVGWTLQWLDCMKKLVNDKSFCGEMPKYGFADPTSYDVIRGAVHRLRNSGAVRHGPECFNYCFPQELDDYYLVISDTLPGKVPWKYVNSDELLDILCQKVDEGFTFPLNPKWILADLGWKRVYEKLMASDMPHVQQSMAVWYPQQARQRIASISTLYPRGFLYSNEGTSQYHQTSEMKKDIAEMQLISYQKSLSGIGKLKQAASARNTMRRPSTLFSASCNLLQNARKEGKRKTRRLSMPFSGTARQSWTLKDGIDTSEILAGIEDLNFSDDSIDRSNHNNHSRNGIINSGLSSSRLFSKNGRLTSRSNPFLPELEAVSLKKPNPDVLNRRSTSDLLSETGAFECSSVNLNVSDHHNHSDKRNIGSELPFSCKEPHQLLQGADEEGTKEYVSPMTLSLTLDKNDTTSLPNLKAASLKRSNPDILNRRATMSTESCQSIGPHGTWLKKSSAKHTPSSLGHGSRSPNNRLDSSDNIPDGSKRSGKKGVRRFLRSLYLGSS